MIYTVFKSPLGELYISEENTYITGLYFTRDSITGNEEKKSPLLLETCLQLEEYFSGTRQIFDLPLAPKGTLFMQKVWKELLNIPYGETCSYQELAEKIGNPKASRAVGMANNRNPISIIIPCHRVIGKNAKLVGYEWGLEIKEALLLLEKRCKGEILL